MNYRRIFAVFALPYLLYLEALKPPGMGSGRSDDEVDLSEDEDMVSEIESDEEQQPAEATTTDQQEVKHGYSRGSGSIASLADGYHSMESERSKSSPNEDEQWIYKGARDVNPRRGTQIFNQMQTLR
eukprot:Gregarina_sp_Pseudo_9__246@NODE_1158_length_1826_cov_7_948517_g1084_i0_p2_GENE_NODE_1158_length_1826_cov_7_948517_g1084_i0NODE_1158_length_1826_cov_7_948517_g1084_i0_p2_ORF_typecomplete_len127_score39_18_NODE_1158_length_1826_cov_7_948517_g1084_i0456836